MALPSIETLPPELQQLILSYVPRPTDLKALCLVTKQLRQIATPNLYREVLLDVVNLDHIESFCTPNHPGHRFVRSFSCTVRQYAICILAKRAHEAIRRVLRVLPRNALHEVLLPGNLTIDKALLSLLCTQQRALRCLSMGPVLGGHPAKYHSPGDWLPNLEVLVLPPKIHDTSELDFYGRAMRECRKLKNLCIGNVKRYHMEDEVVDMQDTASGGGPLFSRLFGHINRSNPVGATQLLLSDLCLSAIDLAYSDRTYLKAIDFTVLTELGLDGCKGISPVLSHLASHFESNCSHLRGLSLIAREDELDVDLLIRFLRSFSSLEYLCIASDNATLEFDASCLDSHHASLVHLYLSFGASHDGNRHQVLCLEAVQSLSRHCKRLGQIALALPDVAISEAKRGQLGNLRPYIDSLRTLPSLEILRILTWPTTPSCYTWKESASELCGLYLSQVNDYADHVVGRLAPRTHVPDFKLKLLCIGDSHEGAGPFRSLGVAFVGPVKAACYVIGRKIDCFGQPLPVAIPTKRHLSRYIEPTFDVFLSRYDGYDNGLGLGDYAWRV